MHEQRACPIGPQNQFYWGHNVETQRTGMYKEPGTQCRYKGPILAENNAYSMDQSYGSWHVATCTYVQSLERALVTYKMKVILMGAQQAREYIYDTITHQISPAYTFYLFNCSREYPRTDSIYFLLCVCVCVCTIRFVPAIT